MAKRKWLLFILSAFILNCNYTDKEQQTKAKNTPAAKKPVSPAAGLAKYAQRARQFIKRRRYNSTICFFADMRIASGKKRFFIYNLRTGSVLASGLVAHGSCNTSFLSHPVYSNKPNTGCSSPGRYRVGGKYEGRFGTAYKLYGLDSSNSNAFNRAIVLHAYNCVPDEESTVEAICNSLGCPMVSPSFLYRLSAIIDASEKPVLLWMIGSD